jgi:Family of unknown function (DUF5990)
VQGRPGDRFIYLTWGDVGDDGTFRMFLTDECGGPTCARLKPPALTLSPD